LRQNDPEVVRAEYASETRFLARRAAFASSSGPSALDALFDAVAEAHPRRYLEVGCGPGDMAARVADELGIEVVALDISPRMVELTQARGIDAQVGDVQELPFADGSFDCAVAAWMLYHVPDLDRGLREIARVLTPGGTLVANTGSQRHLAELRALIDYPTGEREDAFDAENGEEALRRHFGRVERHDVDGTVIVRDRRRLVAYQQSLSVRTSPVPDDVPLPFVARTVGAVFVAAK